MMRLSEKRVSNVPNLFLFYNILIKMRVWGIPHFEAHHGTPKSYQVGDIPHYNYIPLNPIVNNPIPYYPIVI